MAPEDEIEKDASSDETRSESGSEASGSEDSDQVETLISGRARRVTAGNRMAQLIEQQEDDEVALLFAEAEGEEDVEFEEEGAEDGSDAQMDSDSDDDDQGPNAAVDEDMEGEKELQRQAKAERAKKRKAQEALTTLPALRKKVKIDPTLPAKAADPAPRPKKKSERVSWLPELNDAPVRASSRKQTMANKEVTHARLKDHETKRRKLLAQMRKAERDREKSKPKQLTQADRLAEALKVEKKNTKSLNRWEAMEKKRAEEQQAKLDALHNRTLEGPVLTFWSGKAKWIGEKLTTVGSREVKSQPKEYGGEKRGRKKKHVEQDVSVTEPTKVPEASQASTNAPVLDANANATSKIELDPAAASKAQEEPQPGLNVITVSKTGPDMVAASKSEQDSQPELDVAAAPKIESGPIPTSPSHAEPESDLTLTTVSEPKADEGSIPASREEPRSDLNDRRDSPPTHSTSTEPQSSVTQEKYIAADASTSEPPAVLSVVSPDQTPNVDSQSRDSIPKGMPDSPPKSSEKEIVPKDTIPPEPSLSTEQPTKSGNLAGETLHEGSLLSAELPIRPNDQDVPAQPETDKPLTVSAPVLDPSQASLITEVSSEPPVQPAAPLPDPEYSARNLIILNNFDSILSGQTKSTSSEYSALLPREKGSKPAKLAKYIPDLCPVTSKPAKYRDVSTGLVYADVYAYKKIQEAKQGKFKWSNMLGCYVGAEGIVAKGVPEGFLAPKASTEET